MYSIATFVLASICAQAQVPHHSNGIWINTAAKIPPMSQVQRGETIVLAEELLAEVDTKAMRSAGARVLAYIDFTRPRSKDVRRLEVSMFEQSRFTADEPSRNSGLLALINPDSRRYQSTRSAELVSQISRVDGIIVNFGVVSNATYKYSMATRQDAINKTGLDPIDFYDPIEMEQDRFHNRAFDLPVELLKPMLSSEVAIAASLVKSIAEVCAASHTSLGLVCDPSVLSGTVGRRVALNGVWPTLLGKGTVNELWVRATDDSSRTVSDLADGLEALGSPKYPLYLYGLPERLELLSADTRLRGSFPSLSLIDRP